MALDTSTLKSAIDVTFPSAQPAPPNDGKIVASALRSQLKSIVDFFASAIDSATSTEAVQDIVGAFLANSSLSGIGLTYDDANNRMNFSVSIPDKEQVQDWVGEMVTNGVFTGLTAVYNDAMNRLELTVSSLDTEAVQDIVGAFLLAGTNVSVTYNDAANTFTISTTGGTYSDEQAQDAIATMLLAGTQRGITVTYDDANNRMSLDAGPAIISIPGSSTGATLTCTALDNRTNRTVLTGNVTFTTITLPANAQLVIFYQQATTGGPFTVNFPSGIIWPASTAPTMPTTAGKYLRVTLTSDGSGIHGNYSSN